MKYLGERGSTTIEAVLSLSLIVTLVSGGLGISYFAFAYVWVERAGYEALVCLASTSSERACATGLRQAVSTALPVGSLGDARLTRDVREAKLHVTFQIDGYNLIEIHKTLRLPLVAGTP